MTVLKPATAEEAADIICAGGSFRIVGKDTKRDFGCPVFADNLLCTEALAGIVEYSPEDLVVVVRAGTTIEELQTELSKNNQWLPIPNDMRGAEFITGGMPGTVGGLVSANLPTRWDSRTRGVRYWVLGMTIVRANGEIAKCGSKVVKNVAGYDAQKMFIGAWGTLGLIVDVSLRVFAKPATQQEAQMIRVGDWDGVPPFAIVRAKLSEAIGYANATFPNVHHLDAATGTIWAPTKRAVEPPEDGWAMFAGLGDRNWLPTIGNLDWMQGIKRALDPENALSPGKLESLLT